MIRERMDAARESELIARLRSLPPSKRLFLEERLAQKGIEVGRLGILPRLGPRDFFPASHTQERLWFLHQLDPASLAYNVSSFHELAGAFDPAALRRALDEIVRRHEALRTTFASRDGELVQRVHRAVALELPRVDLSALAAGEKREAEVRRIRGSQRRQPLDLEHGPLLRLALVELDANDHVLVLSIHHIVSDAWSLAVLHRELGALYGAYRAGRPPPLSRLPIQFGDFVHWQRTWQQPGIEHRQLAYWRRQLAGAPAVLELPVDRPRPAFHSSRGASWRLQLEREPTEQLRSFCRREGVTLFMALVAGFKLLLLHSTAQPDLCVGSLVAGREREEVRDLIGFFANTLVLRSRISGNPGFRELLRQVRNVVVAAQEHQDVAFSKVVEALQPERSLSHTPLVQAAITMLKTPAFEGSASWNRFDAPRDSVVFDLDLEILERSSGELTGFLYYNTDLFDATTVLRMRRHWYRLLARAVESPEVGIWGLGMLAGVEEWQLLGEWNDTAQAKVTSCLHRQVEAQVRRAPDAVALVHGGRLLSYRLVGLEASRLARRLRRLGVTPRTPRRVGLLLEREMGAVISLLAVLKAGGAYVPFDPSVPAARLRRLLEDSGAAVLVTRSALAGRLRGAPVPVVTLDDAARLTDGERGWDAEEAEGGEELAPGHLAYVLYTSGSTGRPKGTCLSHRGVLRLLAEFDRRGGLPPGAGCSWWTSLTFDVSVYEIFSALVAGGRLEIVPEAVRYDGARLSRWILERDVASAYLPPFALGEAAGELISGPLPPPLRRLLVGVEPIPEKLLTAIAAGAPGLRVINGYGPTEATVCATLYDVGPHRAGDGSAPIGRAVAGGVVHVLSPYLRLVPVGVVGELAIGGDGLAWGYVNRPGASAERFAPDPFSAAPGERLYRTGDQARRAADGNVRFIGRLDFQVKIRGHRVELGEVEAVLGRHPAVREAAVTTRSSGTDRHLVAYVVYGAPGGSRAGLREWLAAQLPGYMVPAAFVELQRLPRTPNDKVDRNVLPAPAPPADGENDAGGPASAAAVPRGLVAEGLAEIWRQILQLARLGPADDFFALGGHSLNATRVLSRISETFGVDLPLAVLFEERTLGALARRLEGLIAGPASVTRAGVIAPLPEGAPQPLSFAQERLWFIDQMLPGQALYTLPALVELEGALDGAALERTLSEVERRHAVLRTTFHAEDGRPFQVVHPARPRPLPLADLSALPEAQRGPEVRRLVARELRRPFDLGRGPLLKSVLLRLAEHRHMALNDMHHIVSDAWSVGLLVREVTSLYRAFRHAAPSPLLELAVQYADFAAWQRGWLCGEVMERQLAYWKEQLAGAPTALHLATDRRRPATATYRGAATPVALPQELSRDLRSLGWRSGATLFMTLLAAFQALLHRWSGQYDFTVGTPVAGRNRTELEDLIGFFVNTLVLRAEVSGRPSFRELLARVRKTALEAHAHQDLPFERLVQELEPQRDLAYSPLFQVLFVVQNAPTGRLALPDLELRPMAADTGTEKFDLDLTIFEPEGMPDGPLRGFWSYKTDLFDATTIGRMGRHFEVLLAAAVAAPQSDFNELPVLAPGERHQLLVEWAGAGERPALAADSLDELFAARAGEAPESSALTSDGAFVSYGELDRRAGRLARRLRRLGAGPEVRVALAVERSADLVTVVLAVLRAGAACVPLDTGYPGKRVAAILEDADAALLVTRTSLFDGPPPRRETRVLYLESPEPARDGQDCGGGGRAPVRSGPDHLAYVIYTSGSTGRPKGVGVTHRNVLRLFSATEAGFGFGAGDVWTLFHSAAFDFSVWEMWGALLYGGRLVVVPHWVSRSPGAFRDLLARQRVTFLNQTPSAFGQLAAVEPREELALRRVVFGGEALELESLRPWFARHGDRTPLMVNMYGITETTVHVTARFLCLSDLGSGAAPASRASPVGRPLGDLRVWLADRRLGPVPLGAPGEILVGGGGVARGYLGRPRLTAERFVPDRLSGAPGERLYRSGDLARWQPATDLVYLGRVDRQVKVRGFRVELGEIEAALLRNPTVREAVVEARFDRPAGPDGRPKARLVAYVVPRPGASPGRRELREHLAAGLPDFMVPAAFVLMPELPLTPQGKVDRRALPAPASDPLPEDRTTEPRTPVEELLAGIWSEVLAVDRVGAEDDFFELGGHSLLATQVVARVRRVFAVELPVKTVFTAATVARLAAEIEAAQRRAEGLEAPPLVAGPRTGEAPASHFQERLWFIERLDPESSMYVIPAVVHLRGALEVAALERSLSEVVRRHDSLRTTFDEVDGEPRQRIGPPVRVSLPVVDLSGRSASPELAVELAISELRRPFDLKRGPLLRATLVRRGPDDHLAILALHHIVADGWSIGILIRELSACYQAFAARRRPVLPPAPEVRYADFARWQRRWLSGGVLEAELAYWRRQLAGAPSRLELPTDRPRPEMPVYRGARRWIAFSAELSQSLRELSRQRGATLFMALVAGFQTLLGRVTGERDICLGTTVAGRTRAEVEGLIGPFLNNLVLRGDLSGEPDFVRLLECTKEVALGAYAHQDLPFEKLVEAFATERDRRHAPLYQVMLVLQNAVRGTLQLTDLRLGLIDVDLGSSKLDLTLSLFDSPRSAARPLAGVFEYKSDLFDRTTVIRLGRQLGVLFAGVAADPERCIWDLPLLTGPEHQQVMREWRGTGPREPSVATVHELFEARARRTPELVAASFAGARLTYGRLNARANRLARRLTELAVGPEVLAALVVERSFEMLVGLLGILKAGGAFLPLAPDAPIRRLAAMLADARVPVMLTRGHLAPRMAEIFAGETVLLDEVGVAADESDLAVVVRPENPAYVIYTSGSTGRPKGVTIPHRAVVQRLLWAAAELEAGDGYLQRTAVTFDAAVAEVFAPLLAGGRAVLARPGGEEDVGYLARLVVEEKATHFFFSPLQLAELLEHGSLAGWSHVKNVLVGGEALPPELPERFHARLGVDLKNRYGPTETTISVLSWTCRRAAGKPWRLPIGRPIAGARVHVLDRHLHPLPAGAAGELCVAGFTLARGYLARPRSTAERFTPVPADAQPGTRLYRTGDLGRFRSDGVLEFLGRIDHQVQVRGFRVELGEVEAALLRHPAVREAVVVGRRDELGAVRLVAHVLLDRSTGSSARALRSALEESLPAYMLPAIVTSQDPLPRTPGGKVDRRALPELPAAERDDDRTAPRTPAEELMAQIWTEVLGRGEVGVFDNFFELGGHSLLATRIVSRARRALRVELSLRTLFDRPTVAELAAEAERLMSAGESFRPPPLAPAPRSTELPLSFSQRRLWALFHLAPRELYNVPSAVRWQGPLDAGALRQAVAALIRRHEALRTSFHAADGEPVQVVHAAMAVALPLVDLSGLGETRRQVVAARLTDREAREAFDLTRAPLLRVRLVRLAERDHRLLLTLHHIVSDGWSMGILVREIGILYQAFSRREAPALSELPVQYPDFAVWQRRYLSGPVLEARVAYWRRRLAGVPAVLELPVDRPRRGTQSYRGRRLPVVFPAPLSGALRRLARDRQSTLFITMLAALQALLGRHAGQRDFSLGTPVAGRGQVEVEGLIGVFVNTLVLRADLASHPTFDALLEHAKTVTLEAHAQELPFEILVDRLGLERDPSHSPLFQVLFVFQNTPRKAPRSGAVDLTWEDFETGSAKFDLSLELIDDDGPLRGSLEFKVDLFDATTVRRLGRRLEVLAAAVATAPERAVGDLPLLTLGERHELVAEWNDTARDAAPDVCLDQMVQAQARRTPEAVAVVFERDALSYAELGRRSDSLAAELRRRGVGPESLVGVSAERSLELVVALLAVVEAGAAYVPFDPSYPTRRLAVMLAESGAAMVLAEKRLRDRLPASDAEVFLLERRETAAAGSRLAGPVNARRGDQLAYVIFTSGTTGRPKGAGNTHRAIVNRLAWMQHELRLGAADRVLQKTPFSFDVSVWELFWPLITGARLVMARPGGHQDPHYLAGMIADEAVTTLHFVPSMLQVFLETPGLETSCASLRRLIASGEALPDELVQRLRTRLPAVASFNLYGPTEAAVDVTWWPAARPASVRGTMAIGRPIANLTIHLLDPHGALAPTGVTAEIHIGGRGLARGYVHRPARTAASFVPDRFAAAPGARLYRTGDLARRLPGGAVEFIGRRDDQVKVRGLRVELGEIEAVLSGHPAVREAAVVLRSDPDRGPGTGHRRLVAFLVPARGAALPPARELRRYLCESLPENLVPAAFLQLAALPLSPSGKLDRRALPPLSANEPDAAPRPIAPRNAAERTLVEIWRQVLRRDQVGIYDNFFELGGDSILGLQMVFAAERAGFRLRPQQIFEHPTLARLAAVAVPVERAAAGPAVTPGPVPLTPIQHWFFAQERTDPHHFNQALLLRASPPPASAVLEAALRCLTARHDALHLRFTRTAAGWRQWIPEDADAGSLHQVDLAALAPAFLPGALEEVARDVQASLDLERGPLLRAVLVRFADPGEARLLIAVHHLAVDGVSWRVLVEELETSCRQLSRSEAVTLPPRTSSFMRWAKALAEQAGAATAAGDWRYWTRTIPAAVPALPEASHTGETTSGSSEVVSRALDVEETRALLEQVPAAYRTRIDEVLLTALARGLAQWSGSRRQLVDLEGHGRESPVEGVDVFRTVGWFTTICPVLLDLSRADGPGEELKAIKEQLRAIPRRGIDFGLTRYLSPDRKAREALAALPRAQVSFNYLGQIDRTGSESSPGEPRWLTLASEPVGPLVSPRDRRVYLLDFQCRVAGGRLEVSAGFSRHRHRRELVESLLGNVVDALRHLISFCLAPEAGGCTPADFPLAGLDQARLDGLAADPRRIEDVYPLTPTQQGMLFFHLYDPGSKAYFEQVQRRFRGDLDVEALMGAWQELLDHHPVLRTAFVWEGLPREPLQVVFKTVPLPWREVDWRGLPAAEQEARWEELLSAERNTGFDLSRPPIMSLTLARLTDDSWLLNWSYHHILLDGWSGPLLRNELFVRYLARCRGVEPDLPPRRPFRDYVAWLVEQDRTSAGAFWRRELEGYATPISLGREPATTRPRQREERFTAHENALPAAITAELRRLAARARLTLNTLTQAAWALTLARLSGRDDVVFGATVAGRSAPLAGIDTMIGLFINTLPVRVRTPLESLFPPWLEALHEKQVEARRYEHSHLMEVQQWSAVPPPLMLFESILVFENYPREVPFHASDAAADAGGEAPGGARVVAQPAGHFQMSSYPLTLLVGPAPDVLIFSAGFDRRYFDDATARRILSTLCTLLTGIAENPRRCLGELPVMTPGELHQLLVTWNRTAADTPWQTPVHRLFEAQAQRTADAPAVVLEDEVLTYGELNRCANRLAHRLRTLGVGPEARVALFLRRSPEMVIAVFAVLKAGGAYVPLEPETPRERLEFLVDDARAHFLLAQERLIPRLPRRRKVRTLGLEAEMAQSAKASCTDLRRGAGPRNLAYLIYTSGSTGRPKAVMIEHRSLADYSALAAEGAALAAGDRVLQFASLSFDASAEEIFPCLIRGATLVLRTDAMLETTEFTATCRKWRITVLDLPTAYWHELAAAPAAVASELPASVRLVILGGERVRPQAVAAWYERVGQAALLVNTYGPTEATVVAAMSPLSSPPAEWESAAGKAFDEVPIGRPRGNTRAYVTDRALRPVAVRVAGELLLGGLGLARGYHGRPGMTAEKFLPDSFGDGAGERLYRTGDLVRHRDDALADRREAASQLEFLGRVDHQVKIRGFRIELGDVEAALASHPMVSEAVVTARGEAPARLVAYFVRTAAAGAPPSSDQDLRGFLLDKLPEYMVPARFVELETLPVSASGKVDRGALPHPEGQRSRPEQTHAAPRNEMESRLVAIWEDVFAIAPVGIDDDFFALGGNSLLALRLMSRIRADLGCQLPLAVLFERGTVRQLAGVLRGDGEGQAWTPLVAIHKEGSRPPFFCVHPAGGDVLCYHGLARLLGADQPFYGLKAAGLDGRHEPHTTIEEMAASYVSAIREFQESGPFLLGGWSFGGVVAFEMARQLERQGREVGGLALFDTAIPQQTERLDELGLLVVFAKNLGVRITESSPVTLTDFAGLPRGAQLDYVLERAKAAGSLPGETSDVALERLWRVYASFFHAVGRYRPQSYGGRMLLLRAGAKPQEREQARETNWRPYVEGGIDVEWVGGSHIELVFEPHVRVLARALGTWLSSRAFRDGEG